MSTGTSGGGKGGVGPAAIVISLIVLAAIVFLIYHFTFAPKGPAPSAENEPAYARQHGNPGYGPQSALSVHTRPGGQQ